MARLVQVGVLEGAGVMSMRLLVSAVVVGRSQSNMLDGRDLVSVRLLVSVVVASLVLGMSPPLHLSLEAVAVVLVVHHTTGAISLDQRVVARHGVSIALLLLLLDVAGVRVLYSVRELVVGRGMLMMILLVMMAVTTVQGQDGSSGQLLVVLVVSVVSDDLVAGRVTVVDRNKASAGQSQHAQDGNKSESHCKYSGEGAWELRIRLVC